MKLPFKLGARFIEFLGVLAYLGMSTGCPTNYFLNEEKSSKRIDVETYAKHLRKDKVDDKFTTPDEIKFEKLYKNLNLKGEIVNLSKQNINRLIECLQKFPKETIKKLPDLDVILAMPNSESKYQVDFSKKLNKSIGGEYRRAEKLGSAEKIVIYKLDKTVICHEFAHAIHHSHPEKDALDKEWNNIEVLVNNEIKKLGDLYDPSENFNDWDYYGFAWEHGTKDLEEDVAGLVHFILNESANFSSCGFMVMNGRSSLIYYLNFNENKFKKRKEGFSIMQKKGEILVKYGFIKKEDYVKWTKKNEKIIYTLKRHIYTHKRRIYNKEIKSLCEKIPKFKDIDKIIPFLKHEDSEIKFEAIKYVVKFDKGFNYAKEVLPFLRKRNISNRPHWSRDETESATLALKYITSNDKKGDYRKNIIEVENCLGRSNIFYPPSLREEIKEIIKEYFSQFK